MFAASKTAAAAAGTPPASTDPQFNYVTMLLHGDGTNGAQNNTFVDSSTNNFTITRNGTPTQGSFSPYGDLWSNQFNGSSSGISAAANTAFAVGTGDFTIEFWANWTTVSSILPGNVCHCNSNGTLGIYITNSLMQIARYNTGGDLQANTTQVANQWDHYAFVRSGGTGYIFKNGVQVATGAISTNYGQNGFVIGFGGSSSVSGYISNLRFVKGTALYTSNFTPSTTPLTAVSGTSLLTCQSNRFRDASSNNFAITVTGTPSVQRFSPFDPAAEYSTSVIGGSAYFSGSSQYLDTPSIALSNSDFTYEAYLYRTANPTTEIVFVGVGSGSFSLAFESTSSVVALSFNGVSYITQISTTVPRNQWFHLAVTRSGSSFRVFINGSQVGSTATSTGSFSTVGYRLGASPTNTSPFTGYMSNVRLVIGTSVYTSNFTPPTAPLTAITNTSLLLNCVNAGIVDNAMMNDLVTVGNAQVSTAVKKYGTGSMAFDGSGDNLSVIGGDIYNLPGDFTVECWVYISGTGVQRIAAKWNGAGNIAWLLQIDPASYVEFGYGNSGSFVGSLKVFTAIGSNAWKHIAITRSGTTVRMFVDGTQIGSGSNSSNLTAPNTVAVTIGQAEASFYLNGYIDDLRITKGIARYTANFTPPTAPFPNN